MRIASLAIIVGCMAGVLPLSLTAAVADRSQPIEVEADSLEIQEENNLNIYSGNVRFSQGSLEIHSESLVIHFNESKDVVRMEMTGAPATFRQLDNNNQEVSGGARQLDYYKLKSLLMLTGDAYFKNQSDRIDSGTIRINIENDNVEAENSDPEQRVRMVIQPRKEVTE